MRPHRRLAPTARRTVTSTALLALVAVLAAACADPVTEPAATPPPAASGGGGAPDAPEPGDTGPGRAGPENRVPDDLLAGPEVCVAAVAEQVLGTINTQLDDLARGDFAAALSQATTAFQAGTDAATFRALIEDSFPLLLEDATAELSTCVRRGPATVEAEVQVATGDRVRAPYVYRLRRDEGRWAIEAAARLTPPPATA